MSGLPYNELQDVDITATDKDGVTHVLATEHYAFVIPCRECKHLRRDDPWWECHRAGFYVGAVDGSEPDGFCAWGERKSTNQDEVGSSRFELGTSRGGRMTATDRLRAMLDERGAGCVTDDGEYVKRTTWHGVCDKRATFIEYVNGECRFAMDDYNFTPEQAIAATLGHSLNNPSMSETLSERGTCRWEYPQGTNGWLGYMVCSGCGERFDECVTDTAHYCPNCGRKVEG